MNNNLQAEDCQEETRERTIQAAARVIAKAALDLIQADPHQWSSRPCSTCHAVSSLLGKPFGCTLKASTIK